MSQWQKDDMLQTAFATVFAFYINWNCMSENLGPWIIILFIMTCLSPWRMCCLLQPALQDGARGGSVLPLWLLKENVSARTSAFLYLAGSRNGWNVAGVSWGWGGAALHWRFSFHVHLSLVWCVKVRYLSWDSAWKKLWNPDLCAVRTSGNVQ